MSDSRQPRRRDRTLVAAHLVATATERESDRARAVVDAVAEHFIREGDTPYVARTSRGVVSLSRVTVSDSDGTYIVEVSADDPVGGDPNFRIINPPLQVVGADGQARLDPLAAIAEVVGQHGGTLRMDRRR